MQAILLSGLVMFCSFTLEAITGFGCTVMALPFVTALLGMREGVVVLTILGMVLSLYVTIRNFKAISWRHYLTIVLLMLPGLFLGRRLQSTVDSDMLKTILAVFIILVSGFRLIIMAAKRAKANKTENPKDSEKDNNNVPWYSYLALLGAGVIHGMFSSGGPLAIIYTTKAIREKNSFRATLCLLWSTLNLVLTITYLVDGSITADIGRTMLYLVPFMVGGIALGDIVANKVNDRIFTLMVYICLLLTGIFMLV